MLLIKRIASRCLWSQKINSTVADQTGRPCCFLMSNQVDLSRSDQVLPATIHRWIERTKAPCCCFLGGARLPKFQWTVTEILLYLRIKYQGKGNILFYFYWSIIDLLDCINFCCTAGWLNCTHATHPFLSVFAFEGHLYSIWQFPG